MSALRTLDDKEVSIDVGDYADDCDPNEEIDSLSPRQERALEAVLNSPTLKEAALISSVSETTLWRYMRDPMFKRRLRAAQEHRLTQTAICVQRGAGDAVSVLYEIMMKGNASDSVRIAAARFFFENSFRIGEVERLKTQMEELQELYRSQKEEAEVAARMAEKREEK